MITPMIEQITAIITTFSPESVSSVLITLMVEELKIGVTIGFSFEGGRTMGVCTVGASWTTGFVGLYTFTFFVVAEAVVAAAVAVVSVALVLETCTLRIGAPRFIAFDVSLVVKMF